MSTSLTIPAVGKGVSKVTLLRWMRNDGEFVNEGDAVAELETSKAVVELRTTTSGLLQTSKAAGSVAVVGEIVGWIEESALHTQLQELKTGGQMTYSASGAAKAAAEDLRTQLPKRGGWDAILGGSLMLTIATLAIFQKMFEGTLRGWVVFIVMALNGCGLLRDGVRVRRLSRAIRWILDDRCAKCGYDLRASVDRCPECGRWMFTGPTPLFGKYKPLYRQIRPCRGENGQMNFYSAPRAQ